MEYIEYMWNYASSKIYFYVIVHILLGHKNNDVFFAQGCELKNVTF